MLVERGCGLLENFGKSSPIASANLQAKNGCELENGTFSEGWFTELKDGDSIVMLICQGVTNEPSFFSRRLLFWRLWSVSKHASSSQGFTRNHLQLGYSHETNGGSIDSISTTSFLMCCNGIVIYLDGTMSYTDTPPLLRSMNGISTWHRMQRTEPL